MLAGQVLLMFTFLSPMIENRTYIPSPDDLLFDLSINVLLLGFERFDLLAKVMSALTRIIVILQINQ